MVNKSPTLEMEVSDEVEEWTNVQTMAAFAWLIEDVRRNHVLGASSKFLTRDSYMTWLTLYTLSDGVMNLANSHIVDWGQVADALFLVFLQDEDGRDE